MNAIASTPDIARAKEKGEILKRALKNYIYKKTKQSPMIIPMIIELDEGEVW